MCLPRSLKGIVSAMVRLSLAFGAARELTAAACPSARARDLTKPLASRSGSLAAARTTDVIALQ
jgi:hypothetical protein